jgi:hypothetical protein
VTVPYAARNTSTAARKKAAAERELFHMP